MNVQFLYDESRQRHQDHLRTASVDRLAKVVPGTGRKVLPTFRPHVTALSLAFRKRLEILLSVGTPVAPAEEIW